MRWCGWFGRRSVEFEVGESTRRGWVEIDVAGEQGRSRKRRKPWEREKEGREGKGELGRRKEKKKTSLAPEPPKSIESKTEELTPVAN